jgi:predicted DNA-binding transcriptional regulator AlpA
MPSTAEIKPPVSADLDIIDFRQLLEIYGVHRTTLLKWIEVGQVPKPGRIGRKRYWYRSTIAAAIRKAVGK